MASSKLSTLEISSRVAAGLLGGYVFTWSFTALLTGVLLVMEMRYPDAISLSYVLALLLFPTVLCWAFVVKNTRTLWATLLGGGLMMALLFAWVRTFI